MDFVEGLPGSCSYSFILVVVDRLSKFDYFIFLTHSFTTKQMGKQFIERVSTIHSMSEFNITNRDLVFLNGIWREFFKL